MAEMEAEIIEEVPLEEVETIEQDVDIQDMEDGEYDGIAANDVTPDSKMYRSFKCHICKIYFTRLHTLKSHISANHPELDWNDLYRTTTFKCGEGSCKYIGKTRTDLLGHLYQEHDFLLHKVEGEFLSTDDFTVFFEKLQKVHKVRFVKKRGKSLESATQYFVCSRDGYVKTGRAIKFGGEFVRKRNTSSHKIGTFCTAHVSVRSCPDGRITIEGFTTHYNHAIEGKRLALLDSERKFIKYHAQRGKSIREIIELIHHTIGANVAEDDPLRFLNARTVRNVVNSVSVEVPSTAEQLFFQINGPEIQETEIEEPIPKGRPKGVSVIDVVRGHQKSIEESYKLFLGNHEGQIAKEEWTIQNERSPTCFKVSRQEDKCPTEASGEAGVCPFTCVHCKCCTHIYTCNCSSGKSGKMCQHIHAICQYLRRLEREQKMKQEMVEEVCVADADQVQILHLQEGVSPDDVQVIEGIEHGEILEEELEEAQHIEITQVPMNQMTTRSSAGQRQHAVTALVFHDYERKSPEVIKNTIDPEFIAAFEEIKQQILHIENSIQTEDIVNLGAHYETLKNLVNRTETPKW